MKQKESIDKMYINNLVESMREKVYMKRKHVNDEKK